MYVFIGGSVRIYIQELLEAYEHEGIDPKPYCWFMDERRYETYQHGGYGLGVHGRGVDLATAQQFLASVVNGYTVRMLALPKVYL